MATAAEINQIYQDILGRDAGQEGLDYWTQDDQGSLDQIKDAIAQSDEAKTNIANLYDELLNRDITSAGSDEFSTNAADETDASYWLGEGGLAASGGTLAGVKANIMLSDEYQALQGGNDDGTSGTQLDDAGANDTDGDGIINDDEVAAITTNTATNINTAIDDALANNGGTDVSTITSNTLDAVNAATGGTSLTSGANSNLATGSLDQTNNEAVAALDATLAGATNDVASLDLDSVLDQIGTVQGDLTQLQGDFSGLQTQVANSGAQNLAQIQSVLAAEGYDAQISNLDSTFNTNINNLTTQLGSLTQNVTQNALDVTDLSGQFQSDLATLQSDLTASTSAKFNALQSDYDSAVSKIAGLQSSLNSASATAAANLANQKKAFDAKMAANMAIQQNNFTNLSTDVNSKLTNYSEEQKAKFADVYKTRDQAIGELQTEWGSKLQQQEAGLQSKIQATAENLNERLTNISKNMNYRMLGDSAAGIKMRRSKAFTSGKTSQGTGQMNRAMRIQSLNL
mgnify:CR=1 FL=1